MVLITALHWFLTFVEYIVLARVIVSLYVSVKGVTNPIYDFLVLITEPILSPIRALILKSDFLRNSPFDFSIIILYLIIMFLRNLL